MKETITESWMTSRIESPSAGATEEVEEGVEKEVAGE